MNELLTITAKKIEDVVHRQGSITFSNLEYTVDASYNLIFLAIDRLVSEGKINIRKGEWDYIISIH